VSIAVGAPSTLGQDGLSRDQLLHFAKHGWVLLEDVIDPDLCRACCDAGRRMEANLTSGRTKDDSDRGNTLGYREPHMHDPVLFELYKIPGLLAAARQIVGYDDIRYIESLMTIVSPDRERHTNLEMVNDRSTWGWHRAYRPKDIVTRHDTDPQLINSAMVSLAMYFVPVSPEHGMTALLDKSHEFDEISESYNDFADRYEFVQPTAGAGSIMMFTEALLHTPAPVLSDQRRFAYFTFLAVPWFYRCGEVPFAHSAFADEGLRGIFAPSVEYNTAL